MCDPIGVRENVSHCYGLIWKEQGRNRKQRWCVSTV
jgi:hypothetical protein